LSSSSNYYSDSLSSTPDTEDVRDDEVIENVDEIKIRGFEVECVGEEYTNFGVDMK